jgi:hypothetical protein
MRKMVRDTCALYGAEPHFFEHPTKDFAVARLGDRQSSVSGAA